MHDFGVDALWHLKAHSLQLLTPSTILQMRIYICLPDRNYVQEDTCLPDQTSIHEDLAETAPLAHDDLGCPIRRDRLYQEDSMGATAKTLSGPPLSPSLFRSPRSSAPERPSPKAIQASIKESATLAAAISMQWKEEVSAMRRELAELRRDLCKELRAFNSNFNTFTQHYNTWSPQGGHTSAGAGLGLGAVGTGIVTGPKGGAAAAEGVEASVGATLGAGKGGLGTSTVDRSSVGIKEKKMQVSKVSVGTQARSKGLIRQSTADAAVNCPEESEEKKCTRKSLPKQLSMDPSILTRPQSMYVESAIPLSLDPIVTTAGKSTQLESFDLNLVLSKDEHQPKPELSENELLSSAAIQPVTTPGTELLQPETVLDSPEDSVKVEQEISVTSQLINIDPTDESLSDAEPIKKDKVQLPYPVPVVTVSPPEDQDNENMSDSESLDSSIVDKPHPGSQDSALEDPDPVESSGPELKSPEIAIFFSEAESEESPSPSDTPSPDLDAVTHSNLDPFIACPSIVVSEYLDNEPPETADDSDANEDIIISQPEHLSEPEPQDEMTPDLNLSFSSEELQPTTEPEPQDPEWPPLPEPLSSPSIYHSDLVHFDLVMLTSLDQDDLDSVFMDPEPEPFDLSLDSNADNVEAPLYPSDCSPTSSDGVLPSQSVFLDPSMEGFIHSSPQEIHRVLVPQVTVRISPPSSVSPDTSLELDCGPTSPGPDPPSSDTESSPPVPRSVDVPAMAPEAAVVETMECLSTHQEHGDSVGEDVVSSSPERSPSERGFLWDRWQKKVHRRESMRRSASVELWSRRYDYNSAEITYVSLTL